MSSKALGFTKRRGRALAIFLSCCLCAFALPETGKRFIHPVAFETASLMASGSTFSMAIPVLPSIYRGLNGITNVMKPSYS